MAQKEGNSILVRVAKLLRLSICVTVIKKSKFQAAYALYIKQIWTCGKVDQGQNRIRQIWMSLHSKCYVSTKDQTNLDGPSSQMLRVIKGSDKFGWAFILHPKCYASTKDQTNLDGPSYFIPNATCQQRNQQF